MPCEVKRLNSNSVRMKAATKRSCATRIIALLTLLLFSLASPFGTQAIGDTLSEKKRQAEEAKKELEKLQNESRRLSEQYSSAVAALEKCNIEIAQCEAELEEARGALAQREEYFSARMREIYKSGNAEAIEVFLEARDISDFLTRYDSMSKIGLLDVNIINEYEAAIVTIQTKIAQIENLRAQQREKMDIAKSRGNQVQQSIEKQNAYISSLSADIKRIMDEQSRPQYTTAPPASRGTTGSGAGGLVIPNFMFPVQGPCTFTNDWHAPRAVGRVHLGNDIMANYGTPCVACVSGVVTTHSQRNAGLYVRLAGDDGNVYYYMHLQSYGATGRVSQGTVIGTVGDTGNATGTPHLHFEIHPGGGRPVNPYPTLVASFNR